MTQTIQTGKKKGFTLLELLLVIGIIAALVGLAVPYYQDYVNQSKNSIMRANLHLVKKSLLEYKSDVGTYPAYLDHLWLGTVVKQKYLMEIPVDPETDAVASWGYAPLLGGASYSLALKYLQLY